MTSIEGLRRLYTDYKPRKVDLSLKRDLERGWMIPYLLRLDELTWTRWSYWYALASQPDGEHALPAEPIPKIEFSTSSIYGRKLWERACDCVAPNWQGWSAREYIEYVLDWLLFGFGYTKEQPKEPRGSEGASNRLYQVFDLWPLILWPHDDLGDIFAEMAIGKHAGFYPTPHALVKMMADMLSRSEDDRLATVCDSCVGTGRMLLEESNYSLNLSGQDVNGLVLKACLVNGYLYAPWMVRPIQWCWDLAERSNGTVEYGRRCTGCTRHPLIAAFSKASREGTGVIDMKRSHNRQVTRGHTHSVQTPCTSCGRGVQRKLVCNSDTSKRECRMPEVEARSFVCDACHERSRQERLRENLLAGAKLPNGQYNAAIAFTNMRAMVAQKLLDDENGNRIRGRQ